jgi:hypothetical protein
MSATLRLTREGFGIELWRGRFEVQVDGQSVGSIEPKGTFSAAVEPGQHTLRIRHGRYCSPERELDVSDGQTALFRCYGANIWPRWVLSLLIPTLGISLRRE